MYVVTGGGRGIGVNPVALGSAATERYGALSLSARPEVAGPHPLGGLSREAAFVGGDDAARGRRRAGARTGSGDAARTRE